MFNSNLYLNVIYYRIIMKDLVITFVKFSVIGMVSAMSMSCLDSFSIDDFLSNETILILIDNTGGNPGNNQGTPDSRQPQLFLEDGTSLGYGDTVEITTNESIAINVGNAGIFEHISWYSNDTLLGTTAILVISGSSGFFNIEGSYIVYVYTVDAQGISRSSFIIVKVESI